MANGKVRFEPVKYKSGYTPMMVRGYAGFGNIKAKYGAGMGNIRSKYGRGMGNIKAKYGRGMGNIRIRHRRKARIGRYMRSIMNRTGYRFRGRRGRFY